MKIIFFLDSLTYMKGLTGGVRQYADKFYSLLTDSGFDVKWSHEIDINDLKSYDLIHIFSSFTANKRIFDLAKDKLPVVLSPIYDPVVNSKVLLKSLITISSLPGIHSNHRSRFHMVKNANYVFTMSKFERMRLIRDYNLNFNSSILRIPTNLECLGKYKRSGVLFIGDLSNKRQNIASLCDIAPSINANITLVGKSGSKSLMGKIDKIPNINYLGIISNDEKKLLYNTKKVFFLPAFTAGLGLAAVDAAQAGMLVSHTNSGGTNEYIKDYGFRFNPYNKNQMLKAVNNALFSNKLDCLKIYEKNCILNSIINGYTVAINNFKNN